MGAEVLMPGTCGELVQGIINGVNLHITWPINRFSIAQAKEAPPGEIKINKITKTSQTSKGLQKSQLTSIAKALFEEINNRKSPITESAYNLNACNSNDSSVEKTKSALQKLLRGYGIQQGLNVEILSQLSSGKGMASSTADVVAAACAVCKLYGIELSDGEMANLALSIEPTDGSIFDGIVIFDHITGKVCRKISKAPEIDLIVLEPLPTIDTILFNISKQQMLRTIENEVNNLLYDEIFRMAEEGLKQFDFRLIGEAATLSAIANQNILYKPELDDIIDVTRRRGALGVNIAHSGTVYGVLTERDFAERLLSKISHYVPRNWKAYVASVIDGGPRLGNERLFYSKTISQGSSSSNKEADLWCAAT